MMKFAHFVSLFLVCVLMVHAVDGRKHHRHMKRGKERMRPEEGAREIVPKLVRNTNKATDAVLDVVKNDNKATAENKVLPLIKQDTAITASDVQVEAEELPVQTKHRRGRKGRERFAFRKKDEGFHKHKRGFHKRHRGHRKRGHPKINEENLNIKNLGKLIKRAKHMETENGSRRSERSAGCFDQWGSYCQRWKGMCHHGHVLEGCKKFCGIC